MMEVLKFHHHDFDYKAFRPGKNAFSSNLAVEIPSVYLCMGSRVIKGILDLASAAIHTISHLLHIKI